MLKYFIYERINDVFKLPIRRKTNKPLYNFIAKAMKYPSESAI